MSCKDEAEKEAGALEPQTRVAGSQVNGQPICPYPGCSQPLDAQLNCPRGHSQCPADRARALLAEIEEIWQSQALTVDTVVRGNSLELAGAYLVVARRAAQESGQSALVKRVARYEQAMQGAAAAGQAPWSERVRQRVGQVLAAGRAWLDWRAQGGTPPATAAQRRQWRAMFGSSSPDAQTVARHVQQAVRASADLTDDPLEVEARALRDTAAVRMLLDQAGDAMGQPAPGSIAVAYAQTALQVATERQRSDLRAQARPVLRQALVREWLGERGLQQRMADMGSQMELVLAAPQVGALADEPALARGVLTAVWMEGGPLSATAGALWDKTLPALCMGWRHQIRDAGLGDFDERDIRRMLAEWAFRLRQTGRGALEEEELGRQPAHEGLVGEAGALAAALRQISVGPGQTGPLVAVGPRYAFLSPVLEAALVAQHVSRLPLGEPARLVEADRPRWGEAFAVAMELRTARGLWENAVAEIAALLPPVTAAHRGKEQALRVALAVETLARTGLCGREKEAREIARQLQVWLQQSPPLGVASAFWEEGRLGEARQAVAALLVPTPGPSPLVSPRTTG